jgi:hypothetical protein
MGGSVFEKGLLQAWLKNSEWGINLALPHHKPILDPHLNTVQSERPDVQ